MYIIIVIIIIRIIIIIIIIISELAPYLQPTRLAWQREG